MSSTSTTRRHALPRNRLWDGERDQRQQERDGEVRVPGCRRVRPEEVAAPVPGSHQERDPADRERHRNREVTTDRTAQELHHEPTRHADHDDDTDHLEAGHVAERIGDAVPDEPRHRAGAASATSGLSRPYARYQIAYATAGTTAVAIATRHPRRTNAMSATARSIGSATPEHIIAIVMKPAAIASRPLKGPDSGTTRIAASPSASGATQRDLPCVLEVLEPGAEHREDGDEAQRDPGVDPGSHHHVPQQHHGREVRHDHERDVREIRVEPDDGVERTEREDRDGGPVLVVRLEETLVAGPGGEPAVGQDEPLVAAEPLMAIHVEEHDGREPDDDPQRARRVAIPIDGRWRRVRVSGITCARRGDVQAWSSFVARTKYCLPRIFHASGNWRYARTSAGVVGSRPRNVYGR